MRCLRIHGDSGTCLATETDDKGEAVCIFCSDSCPCPIQLRRLKATKATLRLLGSCEDRSPAGSPAAKRAPNYSIPRAPRLTPNKTNGHNALQRAEVHIIAEKPKEENMSTVTVPPRCQRQSAPAGPAMKVCRQAGCKRQLGPNNTCGFCREHRSHTKNTSADGRGVQPHREPQAAPHLVLPNGADHHDREGNRAQPAEETARIESRVDLLLAAIPREEKAKMLCAWMAGTL
jgi:hypothetical protein